MSEGNLFQRMGNWWRARGSRPADSSTAVAPPPSEVDEDNQAVPVVRRGWLSRKPSANERLVGLVNQIQEHLVHQDHRAEQMADSLTRLAHTLSELPSAMRQQADTLAGIAEQIEAGNRNTQVLSESLRDVPRLAAQQNETMSAINRQMEQANNLDSEITLSLQSFGQAVSGLSQSTQAQVSTLSRLSDQADQREGRLAELVTQQSKRLTVLFIIMIAVAVIATATAAAALLLPWLQSTT
jgi:chromosome segregation ATPase